MPRETILSMGFLILSLGACASSAREVPFWVPHYDDPACMEGMWGKTLFRFEEVQRAALQARMELAFCSSVRVTSFVRSMRTVAPNASRIALERWVIEQTLNTPVKRTVIVDFWQDEEGRIQEPIPLISKL